VIGQSPEVITADMTATVFCDSSGVNALARAHEQAAASGSELRLALGGSPTAHIVQLIGLDQIVPVYRDVEESLATPRNGPDNRPAETELISGPVRRDNGRRPPAVVGRAAVTVARRSPRSGCCPS